MHQLEVAHLDIRPENILFEDEWHIRLIDFGSAQYIELDEGDKKKSVYPHYQAFYSAPEIYQKKYS
jgi:protein phosphatase